MRVFRRPVFPADLIPLAPRPEWERYSLFEARGEESHPLADSELAERCGVDHDTPYSGVRFVREEMCGVQWSCAAAYYAWLDDDLESRRPGRSPDLEAPRAAPGTDPGRVGGTHPPHQVDPTRQGLRATPGELRDGLAVDQAIATEDAHLLRGGT